MQLGDDVARTLASVGIDPDRVEKWLGRPCHCKERQEKLNQLGNWVQRVTVGKTKNAVRYLLRIIGVDD